MYSDSLALRLKNRANETPDEVAYIYLDENGSEKFTFKQIYEAAAKYAGFLKNRGVGKNDRCILVFRQNIEVVYAFFGCTMLGASAVPLDFPYKDADFEKTGRIISRCKAKCILTNDTESENLKMISEKMYDSIPVYSFSMSSGSVPVNEVVFGDAALLQFTSGSTSEPKGVVVSNESLNANMREIESKMHFVRTDKWVSWLPYHHDMGLIAGLLTSVYSNIINIFMSPLIFKKDPMKWFRTISEFGGTHTVAPNFAFELLCTLLKKNLDAGNPDKISLASMKSMLSGSEPVRFSTFITFLDLAKKFGMRDDIIRTGYGLAEATLVLTVNDIDDPIGWVKADKEALSRNIVKIEDSGRLCESIAVEDENDSSYTYLIGNGVPIENNQVFITDSDGEILPELRIGEICAAGPTLAEGYWDSEEATEAVYKKDRNGQRVLHTGDAGFWGEDGELYVTGRFKDLIVIHGANYYPADIEEVASGSDPALSYAACAFSASDSEENSLVIIQEIKNENITSEKVKAAAENIRKAVLSTFSLPVKSVVIVKENSIPRTQSDKIQHKKTKELYLSDGLEKVVYVLEPKESGSLSDAVIRSEDDLKKIIISEVAEATGVPQDKTDADMPFMQMGINSEMSVSIVEKFNTIPNVKLDIADIFNHNTVNSFASYLYSKFIAKKDNDKDLDALDEDELAELLAAELD